MVGAAGKANGKQGKVEHAEMFELMFVDVLSDVQPQTGRESALRFCKKPRTACIRWLVSLRCKSSSDAVQKSQVNSSSLHHRGTGLLHADTKNERRALDARPPVVPSFQPNDMVAVWRMMKSDGTLGKRAHHRWLPAKLHGRGAGQLLDCFTGKRDSGVARALAGSESRATSRVASGGGRVEWTILVDFDRFSGHKFEHITGGEDAGQETDEEEISDQPIVAEQSVSKSRQSYTRAADVESRITVLSTTVSHLNHLLKEHVRVHVRIRLN